MERYAITFKGMDRLDTFDQQGVKDHLSGAMYAMLRSMDEDDTPVDPRLLIRRLPTYERDHGEQAFTMMRSASYVEVV